jgi:hypothetical protein
MGLSWLFFGCHLRLSLTAAKHVSYVFRTSATVLRGELINLKYDHILDQRFLSKELKCSDGSLFE